MEPQNKSSVGGIIGTVIIIGIIILGGLYFWGKRIEENRAQQNLVSGEASTTQDVVQNEAATIKSISPSDDLNSIQSDLNNTKLDNLSSETNVQTQ